MKTTILNSKEVATKTNEDVKNQMRPSIPQKDAKNEPVKDEIPTQTSQLAPASATQVEDSNSSAENQQPANPEKSAEAQAEPTKKEIKEELKAQHVRGLDDTVKLVEQLGKKIAQKNKLSTTIGNLDSFIVTQNDDKDDVAGDSKFMRCELAITDDGGEEFVTKNPFIIAKVVEMVKSLCIEKLAEVEASIVIPQ